MNNSIKKVLTNDKAMFNEHVRNRNIIDQGIVLYNIYDSDDKLFCKIDDVQECEKLYSNVRKLLFSTRINNVGTFDKSNPENLIMYLFSNDYAASALFSGLCLYGLTLNKLSLIVPFLLGEPLKGEPDKKSIGILDIIKSSTLSEKDKKETIDKLLEYGINFDNIDKYDVSYYVSMEKEMSLKKR